MARFFKFAMLTTLALAAVTWTAGPVLARPRGGGGGHGGGGHGGGFHGGGFHGGGFHGGGFHGGGFGHRGGFGFGGFYGGYGGYYPSYGYGGYYPDYGYASGYSYAPSYSYAPGVPYVESTGSAIVDSGAVPADTTQNYTYVEHRDGDNIGRVHVRVPANAKVWVDGQATRQKGTDREFMTPPLRAGSEFTYSIKARWNQDGRNVERSQQVRVRANDTANVDLTAAKK